MLLTATSEPFVRCTCGKAKCVMYSVPKKLTRITRSMAARSEPSK
jgi:hypothetical protein